MSVELDFCEYSSDALAQAAYVTSSSYGSDVLTGGTASASSEYSASFPASNAVDGLSDRWLTAVDQDTGWWKYDRGVGNAIVVNKFRYLGYNDNQQIKDFTLQGSNNDSDYDTLLTETAASGQDWQEWTFQNVTAYRYYKVVWTSIITTDNYAGAVEMEMMGIDLQSYSEDTIKTQGTYSLKGTALITDSLNDTLTRTIVSPIDLSNQDIIKMDIRASRTGSNIKIAFYNENPIEKAIGGTITYDGNYVIHTFLSDGTFTPGGSFNVEYLVVAGGGGGGKSQSGGWLAGGGGAGGMLTNGAYDHGVTAKAYDITVGGGGAGGSTGDTDGAQGSNGEDSVFDTFTSDGGGGGGRGGGVVAAPGANGGSGGGGGSTTGADASGGTATGGQGSNGGAGSTDSSGYAAGGGGKGGVGTAAAVPAAGGAGLSNSISGGAVTYAKGGNGSDSTPTAGTVNTGNGGDGGTAGDTTDGVAGGSGIVVLKYLGAIEHTANIASANVFQTETIDISAVANGDKDAIDKIVVTVVNADA